MFPGVNIIAGFGQTEMSPTTCVVDPENSIRKLGSVGRPIPTIAWRVVDDAMHDVPPGGIGEIVYRGPTMMLGYWNSQAATAEAFEGGWFHSGDLVRVDEDGYVWVVDRKKDMIISGGENIYSARRRERARGAPGDRRRGGHRASRRALGRDTDRRHSAACRPHHRRAPRLRSERLARYKLPTDLVVVEALPRNPSGKILKSDLRKRFSS